MVPKVFANDEFKISEVTESARYKEVFGGFKFEGKNLTDVLSALLPYVFALAGLMLFGAIIWSGFQFLTSGGDPKKTEEAKGCLTSAVVGFAIIFLSWWAIQILQIIFHLNILGG